MESRGPLQGDQPGGAIRAGSTASIIEENIHELIPGCRRAALTAEMIVGGIHEVVMSRILANRIDELPGMADDLLPTILMLDAGPGKLRA